ncbi:MAG: 7-cyano-7-deazaguanine synthase QueC [Gammaproteobacteria bacterium]|nr:7-cyano-7-deazaguanine synthase QueC [Gammaproteobacteria bacterium]|tara:strand:- start:724 stop:1392 length:669 start_codon:yes stop_codon:yes gene_type:complete
MARAVVLLSGGMDSATALALAKYNSCSCFALTIDYGQRNKYEIKAAESVAKHMDVLEHKILHFDLTDFGGSALTDKTYSVPVEETSGIPITYVPARNTIFFSFALAWSEVIDAEYIYSGVNAVDYSGYPDCRPKYIEAMQKLINLATKKTIEGNTILIKTPLINLTKAEIILLGLEKGVDFSKTVSCYQITEDGRSCGVCDACRLRIQAFKEVQIEDRIDYV